MAEVATYAKVNELDGLCVRVNQYAPVDEWKRLTKNDRISPGWRYTVGALSLVGYTLLPGRIIGVDNYNPYTNSVYVYSDVPALAMEAAAYAKDVKHRDLPGTYAAVNALFGDLKKFKADYSVIPWATFIDPEVARVGLNEQEAKEKGIAYEVVKYGIDDLDRAIADSEAHGFVKVLTVPGKDQILGVTIVGVHAGDLLAEYVLAMKHGLGLNKILGTIHTYPTLSEANKYAAGEWKRAHQPLGLLEWVRKYHDWKRS